MYSAEKTIRGFITVEGKNGYREQLATNATESDEEKGRIF